MAYEGHDRGRRVTLRPARITKRRGSVVALVLNLTGAYVTTALSGMLRGMRPATFLRPESEVTHPSGAWSKMGSRMLRIVEMKIAKKPATAAPAVSLLT